MMQIQALYMYVYSYSCLYDNLKQYCLSHAVNAWRGIRIVFYTFTPGVKFT